uniref:Translation initiation factor eIF2B subunit delta n=1 Tax=Fibrocapsa japonica TaxID=94617 RepID=A0A6U1NH18_9STRA|mmetsp:Transcript_20995/g.30457  ORF Transcript_20995/g.30457 Transcript_20995/m.30457 type:complete len:279 (+) Transcript_20995:2-838(+)
MTLRKCLSWDLDKKLRPQIQFLIDCRPHCTSMGTAIKHLRKVIAKVSPDMTECDAKEHICDMIDVFIQERITFAGKVIANKALTKIKDGDIILTYGSCHVVRSLLLMAHDVGIKFRVVVCDSRPHCEGRDLLRRLSQAGIDCTYVLINHVSYICREVTKVFLGASAMLSNGCALARVGTALVAMAAHSYNIPVLICCETYKFSERVQLDSICHNELGDPDQLASPHLLNWRDIPHLKLLNLRYDLCPIDYISMVITEVGMIPPTSVPALLREYRGDEN